MAEQRTWWEAIKGESGELLEQVKSLIREGNVRRIVIRQGDRSIAEFPLTVGVVGTVAAPILAAVGAIVALVANCSIAVEREAVATPSPAPRNLRHLRPRLRRPTRRHPSRPARPSRRSRRDVLTLSR